MRRSNRSGWTADVTDTTPGTQEHQRDGEDSALPLTQTLGLTIRSLEDIERSRPSVLRHCRYCTLYRTAAHGDAFTPDA